MDNNKVKMEVVICTGVDNGKMCVMFTPDDMLTKRITLGTIINGRYDITTSVFILDKADKAIIDGLEITGELIKSAIDRRGFYNGNLKNVQLFTTPGPVSVSTLAIFACLNTDYGDHSWLILKAGEFINQAWLPNLKIETTKKIPVDNNYLIESD